MKPLLSRRARTMVFMTFVCLLSRIAVGDSDQHPLQRADTSSPQSTFRTFIDSVNEFHAIVDGGTRGREQVHELGKNTINRILSCLDLGETPEYLRRETGLEAAACLKEVFDRIELPPFTDIPDVEIVNQNPDAWYSWRIPPTDIAISRIAQGERAGEYLFSADTVRRATEFYERVKHIPYRTEGPQVSEGLYTWFLTVPRSDRVAAVVRVLPDWTKKRLGGVSIWQWVALVVTFLAAAIVVWLTYRVSKWRAFNDPEAGFVRRSVTLLFPVTLVLVPLWARDVITDHLTIRGPTLVAARFLVNVGLLLGVAILVVAVFSWLTDSIIGSKRIHPKGLDAQFIKLVSRLLSLVAIVVILLEGGQYLGLSLTTLLAGAGVSGLAIALSAQDILKNVFATMMILLDRPYRVGDRIAAQGFDGIVEGIGLRSTKIRLPSDHVVSIPNTTMAASQVENIGHRTRIRRSTEFHLPLDTPAEKAEQAVEIIRGILQNHEGMDPSFPPSVDLSEFSPNSMSVQMTYSYHPPDYEKFRAFSHRLNLRIKRELEAAGIEFAVPAGAAAFLHRATTARSASAGSSAHESSVVNEG